MLLEHEHDLLMMESGGEGPLAVVVPPPGDFHPRDDDQQLYDHYDHYDYYDHYDHYDHYDYDDDHEAGGLRVEGREAAPDPVAMALAAPERSAVDEQQFMVRYLESRDGVLCSPQT